MRDGSTCRSGRGVRRRPATNRRLRATLGPRDGRSRPASGRTTAARRQAAASRWLCDRVRRSGRNRNERVKAASGGRRRPRDAVGCRPYRTVQALQHQVPGANRRCGHQTVGRGLAIEAQCAHCGREPVADAIDEQVHAASQQHQPALGVVERRGRPVGRDVGHADASLPCGACRPRQQDTRGAAAVAPRRGRHVGGRCAARRVPTCRPVRLQRHRRGAPFGGGLHTGGGLRSVKPR